MTTGQYISSLSKAYVHFQMHDQLFPSQQIFQTHKFAKYSYLDL